MQKEYKSKEELYFSWWLEECQKEELIDRWTYEEDTFGLADPVFRRVLKNRPSGSVKVAKVSLLRACSYTPDFRIHWTPRGIKKLTEPMNGAEHTSGKHPAPFVTLSNESYIDVKAGPTHKRQPAASDVRFPLKQKWMFWKYALYIQPIDPKTLFEATFTPARYFVTDKTLKPRKQNYLFIDIDRFLNGIS